MAPEHILPIRALRALTTRRNSVRPYGNRAVPHWSMCSAETACRATARRARRGGMPCCSRRYSLQSDRRHRAVNPRDERW